MFTKETLAFLRELEKNNNRAWFESNRERYETLVRQPALDFIVRMGPQLARFAPHFLAEARKAGGSLMRVNRDTRFSRNKDPYKTNIGIQFRHEKGRDIHAPGFYVHIAPDECFLGVGSWHPEPAVLGRIRDHIAAHPGAWFAVRNERRFSAQYTLEGGILKRAPKGYPPDHPAIEDLKRKDFIGIASLTVDEITRSDLADTASKRFAAAAPYMGFLCDALDVAL